MERISRVLELREILLSFQTGFNLVNAADVCPILESMKRMNMAVNVWWLCWRQWLMQWWNFLVYLFVVLPCNCGQTVPVDSTEESILLCKSRNPKKLVLKPPLSSVQYAFFRKLVLKCPLNSVQYALLYLLLSRFIQLHIHRILFQRNVTYDRSSEADDDLSRLDMASAAG